MKKFILSLMIAATLLTCAACNENDGETTADTVSPITDDITVNTDEESADSTAADSEADDTTVADTTVSDTVASDTTATVTTAPVTTPSVSTVSEADVKEMTRLIVAGHMYELDGDGLLSSDYSKFFLDSVVSFIRLYGENTFMKDHMVYVDTGAGWKTPGYTVSAKELSKIAEDVFGCKYDFTTLGAKSDEYDGTYYDAKTGKVEHVLLGGKGGAGDGYEYRSHTQNGKTLTIQLDHMFYDFGTEAKPEFLGKYELKLELQDSGIWQISSFESVAVG